MAYSIYKKSGPDREIASPTPPLGNLKILESSEYIQLNFPAFFPGMLFDVDHAVIEHHKNASKTEERPGDVPLEADPSPSQTEVPIERNLYGSKPSANKLLSFQSNSSRSWWNSSEKNRWWRPSDGTGVPALHSHWGLLGEHLNRSHCEGKERTVQAFDHKEAAHRPMLGGDQTWNFHGYTGTFGFLKLLLRIFMWFD